MTRIRRVVICTALASVFSLSAACATASAGDVELTPHVLEFGSLEIGQTSPPQTMELSIDEPFRGEVGFATGKRDFTITNTTCGPLMAVAGPETCTITVIFHPIAPGPRGGQLTTGEYLTRPNPPLPSTQAEPGLVVGFGLCPTCVPPVGPGVAGPQDLGLYGLPPGTAAKKAKKCKRKRFPTKKKYLRCVRKQKRRK